jgi:microcystin-dependent protein
MSTPFISEIRIMAFNFPPKGWALCNGQLLPINQNQPLFSLLGTTYGGDGRQTFALPNLQGRMPIHTGSQFILGQAGGEEVHTLSISELPAHPHPLTATTATADSVDPTGHLFAQPATAIYTAPGAPSAMKSTLIGNAGGSQPHENRMPYLVLNFCIALVGVFPSQN